MQITVKDKKGSKKELTVEVSTEEMEKYLDQAAEHLSQEMEIKGFRKGKAPREVVENSFGKEKFWQESSRIAVEDTYQKALKEKDLFAVSQPEVEFVKSAPGNELVYKAEFYVMPDFELPDYEELSSEVLSDEKQEVSVSEQELDETLERIQNSRATTKAVDREAKKNDEVTIDFTGEVDGEKKIGEEDFKFSLGSGQFSTLEGFEDEILGMKAGENKDFKVSIPEESPNADLAGKEIDFNLELKSVMEKELPELTDEFASSLHKDVSDLDELKEKIREGIKSEKETEEDEEVKMKIVQKLIENTEIDLPEVLVERELGNMKTQMERQLQQREVTFEEYLDQIDKSEEELKEEWRSKAEDNVAAAIILHKVAEKEDIEVEQEEIEKEVETHLKMQGRQKEQVEEKDLNRLRSYIHDMKKNQKIFDFLMDRE